MYAHFFFIYTLNLVFLFQRAIIDLGIGGHFDPLGPTISNDFFSLFCRSSIASPTVRKIASTIGSHQQ